MCPDDTATAGSWAGVGLQLRFGFVAVLEGHIVYFKTSAALAEQGLHLYDI
jgi:hypothetical protein